MSSPPSSRFRPALLDPDAPLALLHQRQRRLIVRNVLTTARLGLVADPRMLAHRMAVDVTYYFPEDGEGHPGAGIAAYAWHFDIRERGWRMHRELGRVLLGRVGVRHNESDILLIAFDLAVPEELALTTLDRLIRDQQHCPEAILRHIFEARDLHSPKR